MQFSERSGPQSKLSAKGGATALTASQRCHQSKSETGLADLPLCYKKPVRFAVPLVSHAR